jgi:hypothetical protein
MGSRGKEEVRNGPVDNSILDLRICFRLHHRPNFACLGMDPMDHSAQAVVCSGYRFNDCICHRVDISSDRTRDNWLCISGRIRAALRFLLSGDRAGRCNLARRDPFSPLRNLEEEPSTLVRTNWRRGYTRILDRCNYLAIALLPFQKK